MKPIQEHGQLAVQPIHHPTEVLVVLCTANGGREPVRRASWPALLNILPAPMEPWSALEVQEKLSRGEEANLGIRL
jgi:hypothetical protein